VRLIQSWAAEGTPMSQASGWQHQPVTAHPVTQFRCVECNWLQLIATPGAPPVVECPWCGWTEVEAEPGGAFAIVACPVHGVVVCIIPEAGNEMGGISPDDYTDLCCPHCRPPDERDGWPTSEDSGQENLA
jgi:hypothetical protein